MSTCKTIRTRAELLVDFEKLKDKKVMIVGCGGTGCFVLNLLARYPLSKIILFDGDIIEESNLDRQGLFFGSDVGRKKVEVAAKRLEGFCPIEIHDSYLNKSEDFEECDLIIDCTDNLETRRLIDEYCKRENKNWIYTGAASKFGTVFFVKDKSYEKYFTGKINTRCMDVGVVNSIVSIVGSWAVSLAIDYLVSGKIEEYMIRINLETNEVMKIKLE